jgi:choline dehydrogenase-like flavoprotein
MSAHAPLHTFDSLTRMSNRDLDRVVERSTAFPAIADVLGFEFRGWNINPTTNITRTRKFKKGFFGEAGLDHAWGYNMPVKQNGRTEPWIPERDGDRLRRYYFFGVVPTAKAKNPKIRNSLVVDYRLWNEYFPLNPVKYTVDYLVYPDPANRDLIVGKSYAEVGFLRPFLGYFILERENESDYDRDAHFLTADEERTVRAFAEVFIEGESEAIGADDVMKNIERQLDRIDSSRKQSLRAALFVIENLLPQRAAIPFRKPFSKMSSSERRRFIQGALADAENRGPIRDLARLRALFIAGYYGDPRVHPSIGFEPPNDRARYQPDKLKVLDRPRVRVTDPAETSITCDICVIGSGAGGAVVAANAAEAGRDVVLLEEGPYVAADGIAHDEGRMTALLYKEGGLQTTVDLDMVVLQGKCLGGTTVINNAICFRLNDPLVSHDEAPDVIADWERSGAVINRAALNSSFDRVARRINVGRLEDIQDPDVPFIGGRNGEVLLDGWQRVRDADPALARLRSGWFVKNYQRCLGCGYCNWGCAYGRKMSMLETYVPAAAEAGARVIPDCHAIGIDADGRRVTRVRCKRRDGRELRVDARAVVISCGAIGSSVLLMKSRLGRNVGSRFSFNAGSPVFGRFPQPLNAFDGLQMASYIDFGEFMLESLFNPPLAFAATLPGWFGTHFERMRTYNRLASAGVLIGTESNGRIKEASGLRRLFGPIEYSMSKADLDKMRRGIARLAQVYFAAGAEQVIPATFADVELNAADFAAQPDRILPRLTEVIRKPEDLTLSSAHPQGGNPMSDDASVGVVDSRFRVHGLDNLYVCDASVFPTTIRINPQLTVMAMADYFWNLGVL